MTRHKLERGHPIRDFSEVLETNGIDNINAKGKDFIFLLGANKFRLLILYFKHDNYVTWGSFNTNKTPHMLDNFICAKPFYAG